MQSGHHIDGSLHRRHKRQEDDCISPDPANTVTDRLNIALNSSSDGFILKLCPSSQYILQAPINFAFPNQEISTVGYPTDDTRATLVVAGPVENGSGHTTAVDGQCATCDGVKLRNVQIDGNRGDAAPTTGGGNIEMGGPNSNQIVEFVRSFNPRSWTCLHIAEGSLNCNNVTIDSNDIGPCGVDAFQQWADGISLACQNSVVKNNIIENPTDGGIVLFGSPGTQVYNNTISVVNQTLLGGVNLVDYLPWQGNYSGVAVFNNTILGGFATDSTDEDGDTKGENRDDVIVKMGIAIGPRAWFGERYGNNVSFGASIKDNRFSGAFSYAIALTSATDFTVTGNSLFGNTSFIGSKGPNCSSSDETPAAAAFVVDPNTISSSTTQTEFTSIADGNSLTCVVPPDGGDYWPFGGGTGEGQPASGSRSGAGTTAGIVVGVILGILFVAFSTWFIRRWALKRAEARRHFNATRKSSMFRQ